MYQQDWILRQIEMLARMLSKLLYHKDTTEYPELDAEEYMQTNLLHQDLLRLIRQGRLNEAENLLFERTKPDNIRYFELAIDFYARLNDLNDKQLEQGGFSREEIDEGLHDFMKMFYIELPEPLEDAESRP